MTSDELAALKHRRLLMTSHKRIKTRRKLKGICYPSAQRLVYLRALNGMLVQLEDALRPAFSMRADSIENSWLQKIAALREKLEAIFTGPRVTWLLGDLAKQIETVIERDFQEQMAPVLGIAAFTRSTSEQLRALFIHDNTKLIQSLPRELVDQIEAAVMRSIRQGSTVHQLEREIQQKLSLTKKHAQLIARDQVSKYSGDLTRHHQAAAGISKYRWETSRDERVRPEHRKLDGQIFSWDKPPVSAKNGGRYHPRQGINCRCDAIPVLS